jgi:hypothetical protein
MPKDINELREEVEPIIVDLPVKMDKANDLIKIYKGEFLLKNKKCELHIDGKIEYQWFPYSGAVFTGFVLSETERLIKSENTLDEYDLIIDGLSSGNTFITNLTYPSKLSNDKVEIKGFFTKYAVFNDSSIRVDSINFGIPNLRNFFGTTVRKKTEKSVFFSRSRVQFENEEYKIVIDKTLDYHKRIKNLDSKGGHLLLYSGRLSKRKDRLTLEESRVIINCFNDFLTFLNGRRVFTVFHTGILENNRVWSKYSNYSLDIYKSTYNWAVRNSTEGLNELFEKFSTLWKNKNDRNFLIFAVQCYEQANNNSIKEGSIENSIVIAQTALELIYNWLLIEKNRLLIGGDSEKINAANKIRLLLSHLKINYCVPEDFNELKELISSSNEYIDAPSILVSIRNSIVHSNIKKRKKLSALSIEIKHQALQLSIWYIEISLLYILGHKGKYYNRCSRELYPIDREINVPWI